MAHKEEIIVEVVGAKAVRDAKAIGDVFYNLGKRLEQSTRQRVTTEQRAAKEIQASHQQTARTIERGEKSLQDYRIREWKRASSEFARELNKTEAAAHGSAKKTQSVFSSFKGGFLGGFAGTIVSEFTSILSQIPAAAKQYIDEGIKYAEERRNAFLGLQSTASFKGFSPQEAEETAKSLRLVKAGIVDVTEAASGEKSLLQFGFNIEQARNLMERFSDSAAFGKQSALTYGQAVSRSAEGVRQFNSGLADAGGMTTNLSIIMKRAGVTQEDFANKKTQAAAITKYYNALMQELAGVTGNADLLTKGYTGTTAALTQAQKNLQITVGEIISQNPYVLAMLQSWTRDISGVTSELEKQDSQQRVTFTGFVEGLAKGAIWIQNLVDKAATNFTVLRNNLNTGLENYGQVIGDVVSITGKAIKTVLYAALASAASALDLAVNGIQRTINGLVGWMNDVSFKIPGLPQLPEIQSIKSYAEEMRKAFVDSFDEGIIASNLFVKNLERNKARSKANNERNTNIVSAYESRVMTRNFNFEMDVMRNQKALEKLRQMQQRNPDGSPESDAATGGTGKGRRSKLGEAGINEFATNRDRADFLAAMRRLPIDLKTQIEAAAQKFKIPENLAFAQIFSESSFNPQAKSPVNPGVGRAFGLTQGIKGTLNRYGFSVEDVLKSPEKSLSFWGKYMTDLFNEFGDWELAVFAYHNGEGEARKFLQTLKGGNKERLAGFIKSRPRGFKYAKKIAALAGLRGDEQFQPADLSKISDELTQAAVDRSTAQLEYILEKFQMLPSEAEAKRIADRRNRDLKLSGDARINEFDVIGDYRRRQSTGEITPGESRLTTDFPERRTTPDEDYISGLRESLGIEDKLTQLVNERRNLEKDISERIKSDSIDQDLQMLDIERALLILRKQNSDSQFTEQRRLLSAKRQEYDIQREITDLQDVIANGKINENLKIQAAFLRDVVALRERETDAVIATNRAQLELSQKGVFSQNQANAKVIEYVNGEVKDLTNTFADFQIGLGQTFFDTINAPFDALGKKLEKLPPVVEGLARTFLNLGNDLIKLFSHKILLRILGLDTGSAGGGLDFGSIFGGQGGSGGIFNFLGGGNQSGGGGIFGIIRNLLGFGGATHAASGGLPSILGGLGSLGGGSPLAGILGGATAHAGLGSILGGLGAHGASAAAAGGGGGLAAIASGGGGLLSGLLGMFGGGGAAAGGTAAAGAGGIGGMLGGLAPLMTNPWTIGIAAAAIGGYALWKIFGKSDPKKKLIAATQKAYGVRIDDSTARTLQGIGDGYFGKNQSGKHADEVVRKPEAVEVIENYAAMTNQKSRQLESAHLSDPNWSGNRFSTPFLGYGTNGGNFALPNTPRTVSASRAASPISGGGDDSAVSVGSVGNRAAANNDALLAHVSKMVGSLGSAIWDLTDELARLKVESYEGVITRGAAGASREIMDAVMWEFKNDSRRTTQLARNTGMWNAF
jgi:hypothetical protein